MKTKTDINFKINVSESEELWLLAIMPSGNTAHFSTNFVQEFSELEAPLAHRKSIMVQSNKDFALQKKNLLQSLLALRECRLAHCAVYCITAKETVEF